MNIYKIVLYAICVFLMASGLAHELKPLLVHVLKTKSIFHTITFIIVAIAGLVFIVNFGIILYGELPF